MWLIDTDTLKLVFKTDPSEVQSNMQSSLICALSWQRKLEDYSVAARFSWAAKREITRKEDRAYCLLGIFGVYVPLLYGESENAFLRLQEEISRSTNDMSIFAWVAAPEDQQRFRGLFARSPAEFINCASVTRVPSASRYDNEYSITNKGLRFNCVLTALVESPDHSECSKLSESDQLNRMQNERIESMVVTSVDLECFNEVPDSSSTENRKPTLGIYLTKLKKHTVMRKDEEQPTIYAFRELTEQQSDKLKNEFHKQVVVKLDFPPLEATTGTRKVKSYVFVRKEGKWEIGRLTLYKPENKDFRKKTALEQFQQCLRHEHDSHHYAEHWDGRTHALVSVSESYDSYKDGKFHIDITVTYKKGQEIVEIVKPRSHYRDIE
ncbi:hypothetical protein PG994_010154 [Apiospora phragmitis]|uniref:DUF8212 domain-containing protein n=1 Tax=Apiospora phragmitis TaxID=2905665 RepID=A0ABR1TRP0_9PEZI